MEQWQDSPEYKLAYTAFNRRLPYNANWQWEDWWREFRQSREFRDARHAYRNRINNTPMGNS